MTFRRTPSGLSNFYLFVDAEAVVFLEGGDQSFNRNEVENGLYSDKAQDIHYWSLMFDLYLPGRKFQFRSVGSKETVRSIAIDVSEGKISNVIVAMDRDFDDFLGSMISGNNIIYTYGYSWENDCCNEFSVTKAVISLSGLCPSKEDEILSIVSKLFHDFRKKIKHAVKADALLTQHGHSFFDRDNYARYVQIDGGKPKICVDQIKESFDKCREKYERPIYRRRPLDAEPLRDCYGHLLFYFTYRVVDYLIKSVLKMPRIPKDYVGSYIAEKNVSLLCEGKLERLDDHYRLYFDRIVA